MGSWKFEEAEAAMALAGDVLDARDEIASDAGDLHLTPPAELKQLFEQDGGLKAAKAEAELQVAVLTDISVAGERVAEKETILESIGLLGADPAANLEAARDAYEADKLDDAGRDADRALAARAGAAEAGQTRVLVAGGGLVVVTGVTVVGVRIRGRRRALATRAPTAAEAGETADSVDEPLDERA
jgi:hypothetical protein